jgi:serine phosphatase RsbU (regulator of sigma subunit)
VKLGKTRRALLGFGLVALPLLVWHELKIHERVKQEGSALESIAAVAAAEIDASLHEQVHGPQDASGAAFLELRRKLREIQARHGLRSPVYTLRPVQDEKGRPATEFVVMTNPTPFIADRYERTAAMEPAFAGHPARTGLYSTATGTYVSGFGPVRNPDGRVVAIVEVDRPSEDLAAERENGRLLSVLAAALGAALVFGLAYLRSDPLARLRGLVHGSLAVRIGLAGTLSVLVALGVLGVLDHREARSELVAHIGERLLTAVQVGTALIDVRKHQQVAHTGDAASAEFLELREALRQIHARAGLSSPLYTLRRDGDLVRFVVMTNEIPFVGDPYELRPGVRQTFETGAPGTEGPYTDAHGTWISAWTPLVGEHGRPLAVLQADAEVGALLTALANRGLRRLLFGLLALAVALAAAVLLARSIARPVLDLAQAAERIASGDLDARVDIERPDEIGSLARAFNRMVHNLQSMAAAMQQYAAEAEERGGLDLAARLQSALAPPSLLRVPGAAVATRLEPAERDGTSTCDAFLFGRGSHLILALLHVPAAGAGALELLLRARSALRALLCDFVLSPRDLARRLDQTLPRASSGGGLRFLAGVYDLEQRWITLLNAGGPYPYLLRPADGTLGQLVHDGGPALGEGADAAYEEFELLLEPDDRLILHTPGLVQLTGPEGAAYGLERLEDSIRRAAALEVEEMAERLWQDALGHAGEDQARGADLGLLVLRVEPGSAAREPEPEPEAQR